MLDNKKKLGKGLGALLKPASSDKELIVCKIEEIIATVGQPRKRFDEDRLKELAESIRQYGIIQPIVVKKEGDKYRIIAGERRFRAAQIAGLTELKAVIFSGEEDYHVALIENLQREDLNPIEIAEAYAELVKRYGHTQQELSEKVGKSRSDIANFLRLLNLSEKVKEYIRSGCISVGQARPLTVLSHEEQDNLIERIISCSLNSRDVEKLAKGGFPKKTTKTKDETYAELQTEVASFIPAAVKIEKKSKKIAITFEFKNHKEFEHFITNIKNSSDL